MCIEIYTTVQCLHKSEFSGPAWPSLPLFKSCIDKRKFKNRFKHLWGSSLYSLSYYHCGLPWGTLFVNTLQGCALFCPHDMLNGKCLCHHWGGIQITTHSVKMLIHRIDYFKGSSVTVLPPLCCWAVYCLVKRQAPTTCFWLRGWQRLI